MTDAFSDIDKLGSDLVTVVRAPIINSTRDNSEVRDWDNPVLTDYPFCKVEPFPTTKNRLFIEVEIDREFAANYYRLWLTPDCDVKSTDRLRWLNQEMDIAGIPIIWTDFEGIVIYIGALGYIREG